MISYSAASASRTRSVSCSAPVAIAWTGVVAIRSRPQEGQNLDLPVISLPQREQNIWGSYREARRCARGNAEKGRTGGHTNRPRSIGECLVTPTLSMTFHLPAGPPVRRSRLAHTVQHFAPCPPPHPERHRGPVPHDRVQPAEASRRPPPQLGSGARLQLRVRDPLPPAPREGHPGRDHPSWREPGPERA